MPFTVGFGTRRRFSSCQLAHSLEDANEGKMKAFWGEREREKPKLAEKVPRKDNKTIKQIDSCRTKDWGKKSLRLRLVKLRTVKERTLTVGGSVAEWLISCLESTASIHTKNNIFSFLSNPILVNWRPAIQRYFPKQ